jgi:hypothetical protein
MEAQMGKCTVSDGWDEIAASDLGRNGIGWMISAVVLEGMGLDGLMGGLATAFGLVDG